MTTCSVPGCGKRAFRVSGDLCRRHLDQKRKGRPFTLVNTPRPANPRSARTQVLAALQAVPTGLTRKQLEASVVGGSVGLALVSLEEQGKVARRNVNGVVVFQWRVHE